MAISRTPSNNNSMRRLAEIDEFGRRQLNVDVDKIPSGEDTRTTLMIKNIPNKYTAKMLLDAINEYHVETYDFLYLPIDFKHKCNVGYAVINMLSPAHIIPFYEDYGNIIMKFATKDGIIHAL